METEQKRGKEIRAECAQLKVALEKSRGDIMLANVASADAEQKLERLQEERKLGQEARRDCESLRAELARLRGSGGLLKHINDQVRRSSDVTQASKDALVKAQGENERLRGELADVLGAADSRLPSRSSADVAMQLDEERQRNKELQRECEQLYSRLITRQSSVGRAPTPESLDRKSSALRPVAASAPAERQGRSQVTSRLSSSSSATQLGASRKPSSVSKERLRMSASMRDLGSDGSKRKQQEIEAECLQNHSTQDTDSLLQFARSASAIARITAALEQRIPNASERPSASCVSDAGRPASQFSSVRSSTAGQWVALGVEEAERTSGHFSRLEDVLMPGPTARPNGAAHTRSDNLKTASPLAQVHGRK